MQTILRTLLLVSMLMLHIAADDTHFFLRNRSVSGRTASGDLYFSKEQLPTLLEADELERIEFDESGCISIDGKKGPEGPGIPLSWLATSLGYSKRTNHGLIDWVKIKNEPTLTKTAQTDWTRRKEFRTAQKRLNNILSRLPKTDRPELQARVESIGRKVVAVTSLSEMPWTFVVVKMRFPNAACTGEGHVFVGDSLLDMGISDDELAGVLGHEIAHGIRRHVFRRSDLLNDINNLLQNYQRLQTQIDQGKDSLILRQQIAAYSRQRDQLQYKFDHDLYYDRLDEEEADVLGLRYAVMAGYSADGLSDFLAKLERITVKEFGTAILPDDMSHPPTARRLEILQRARRNAGI